MHLVRRGLLGSIEVEIQPNAMLDRQDSHPTIEGIGSRNIPCRSIEYFESSLSRKDIRSLRIKIDRVGTIDYSVHPGKTLVAG